MGNFWKNELYRNIVRQKLDFPQIFKNFQKFSKNFIFENFLKKNRFFEKIENFRKFLKFFENLWKVEFLSHDISIGFIFPEIAHTLRLEQIKIHIAVLSLKKKVKYQAEKRKKKFFFPYLEEKIPLVKVLTQKIFPKKIEFFEISF